MNHFRQDSLQTTQNCCKMRTDKMRMKNNLNLLARNSNQSKESLLPIHLPKHSRNLRHSRMENKGRLEINNFRTA